MTVRKNPGGKGQGKIWSDAVRRAVLRARRGKKILDLLARGLVDRAFGGDIAALKEINDRLK